MLKRFAGAAILLLILVPGFKLAAAASSSTPSPVPDPLASHLNPDGTLNLASGFSGTLDARGWALLADPQGGPRFVKAGGNTSPAFAAGSAKSGAASYTAGDENWDPRYVSAPGINGVVHALAVSDSSLYVGGMFDTVSGLSAANIAKWNGTEWETLGEGVDGVVLAIAISGTNVYVGGAFTNVSNETSLPAADYVAKWDGTNWSALGSNGASNGSLNYGVYALAPGSEDLYVGGDFTNANNGGIAITDADYFAAYGFTPLAAGLADFTVQVQEQGILVAWETTSELGNLGFDLWRGETPNAPTQRLNAALIPSQAPGSSQGFSYAWLDQDNLVMGVTYYYWLDVVEFSGTHERHGPLSATWQAPTALGVDVFTVSPGSPGQRLLAWLWRLLAQ